MITISLLLMIVAFVLLLLQGLNIVMARVSLGWLGLAAWVLAVLLGGLR